MYDTNELNQYSAISENGSAAFEPQFDTDGNQTRIKTDTGIWSAVYNAENRPVIFTNSNMVVECAYDSLGRRAYKKVTRNGSVTLHQRYIYRGYLQIACIDLTRSHHPVLWLITWDPSQPVATRPLVIQKDGTWYTYGIDFGKNVREIYGVNGYISVAYTYSPFGKVSVLGNVIQPIQWSSEHFDDDMSLSYYNYRYYNALDGRWITKDPLGEKSEKVYVFVNNSPIRQNDSIGLSAYVLDKPSEYHPKSDEGSGKYASQSMTYRDKVIRGLLLEGIPYFALKYPLAAAHLEHYLMNTGVNINFNMLRYYDDSDFKNAMNEELTSLAQAAKSAVPGKKHIVSSTSSTVGYFSDNDDLYYAIGGFHIWGNGTLEVCEDNTYISNLSINFYDRYNWDKGKSVTIPIPFGSTPIKWMVGTDGPIRINPNNDNELIVEDVALGRLHLQGLAKEYDIKGKIQIQVRGTVGEELPTYKIITR